jgi:hypothetical protein
VEEFSDVEWWDSETDSFNESSIVELLDVEWESNVKRSEESSVEHLSDVDVEQSVVGSGVRMTSSNHRIKGC